MARLLSNNSGLVVPDRSLVPVLGMIFEIGKISFRCGLFLVHQILIPQGPQGPYRKQ